MEKNTMTITCLMSVYKNDNPEFLVQAIESILSQSRIPDEFLIVVDGPISSELQTILNKYRQKCSFISILAYPKNRGLGLSLRDGVIASKGTLIARMDSDDIASKDRLKLQEDFLKKHSDIRFVGSNTVEFIDSVYAPVSKRVMPEKNEEITKYAKTRNPFIHSSVLFYKEDAIKVGNYSDWYLCEDYDLWVKMIQNKIPMYNIQKNLVYMRINNNFYKRRGGIKYCKNILRFKRYLKSTGFMSKKQYYKSAISSLIVSLSPNFVRKFIYKKFLRK